MLNRDLNAYLMTNGYVVYLIKNEYCVQKFSNNIKNTVYIPFMLNDVKTYFMNELIL